MHRLNVALALAAALLLSALAPSVQAATDGPHITTTPIPSTTTDWVSSLTFPQFDSSLGTLTGVQLDLSGSFSTVITVSNAADATSTSSGSVKTEVQMTAQDGGSNMTPTPQLDLTSVAFGYGPLNPGDSVVSPTIIKSGNSSDTYTLAAILAEFTGAGTISLSASTFTQTLLANTGGNAGASQVTDASLTGSVTYIYTPVPEPSTMILLAFGAVSMLLCGRMRRQG